MKRTGSTARGRGRHGGALAAWLALGLAGLGVASARADPPTTLAPAAAAGIASVIPEGQRKYLPWTDQNCNNCHKIDVAFSHPVGVAPSMTVPADLPLQEGRMVCTTCHDSASVDRHVQARQGHNGLLRGSVKGAAFCARCHGQTPTGRAAQHAGMLRQAHLRWPGRSTATLGLPTQPADGDSRGCLSCHDGTIAPDVGAMGKARDAASHGPHPLGVVYRTNPIHAGTIDRHVSFTPVAQLDARIRLVDGQVACASCHSPYASEAKELVMSNRRSSLCLSCHAAMQ